MTAPKRRRTLAVSVVCASMLVGAACDGTQSRVDTAAGLSCLDELVVSIPSEIPTDAVGYDNPEAALDSVSQLTTLPVGQLTLQSDGEAGQTHSITDDDGNQLARINLKDTPRG